MQEELQQELLKIFSALKIVSPGSFSFAGMVVSVNADSQQQGPNLKEPKPLLERMVQALYHHCYCRRFEGAITYEPSASVPDENFVQDLSEANTTVERRDRGWRVVRILPTGHCMVQKSGLIRMLSAGEFVQHDGPDVALQEGANVSIVCPKESRTMHPGFYYVFGTALTDQQDDYDLLRFYWNIKAEGVQSLMRLLTSRLNRFQLPFRFKCLNNPAAYDRTDAAVLYINKRFYRLAARVLAEIYARVEKNLEPNTPLFSKHLAAGLGLAEEPGNGESFGQQRCRLLAESIWSAYALNHKAEHEQIREIINHFELNGLSLDHPYLNSGSIDQYDFSLQENTI